MVFPNGITAVVAFGALWAGLIRDHHKQVDEAAGIVEIGIGED